MNKNERIKAVIDGKETDHVPFSVWSHFPDLDQYPEKISDWTYAFYKKFDLDFIKTMSNGMYSVEDYGSIPDYSTIKHGGTAKLSESPIKSYGDWSSLEPSDISKGALAREIRSFKLLYEKVADEAPIVFTIFSPFTTIKKLSNGKLDDYLNEPDKRPLHHALEVVTKTTIELVEKIIEEGASGIFFATQLSSYDILAKETYEEFGTFYDLQVLDAAKEGWFNILHSHGENIMFELLKDYPVQIFNWHVDESLPALAEAVDLSRKSIMGGLNREDIANKKTNELRHQIYKAIRATGKKQLILTPGCTIPQPFDDKTIFSLKEIKQEVEELLTAKISVS